MLSSPVVITLFNLNLCLFVGRNKNVVKTAIFLYKNVCIIIFDGWLTPYNYIIYYVFV